MRARIMRWGLLVGLAVALAGCALQPLPYAPTPIPTLMPATLPAQTVEQGGGTPVGEAPAAPALAAPTSTSAAGETMFDTFCSACHNLTAEQKVGPGLAGLFARDALPDGNRVTDENLRGWIRTGGGGMPAFTFDDAEMNDLLAFLHNAVD